VIAAVNGMAFGGGCEITEAVHLAVASERTSFAKPEIKLGMPPTSRQQRLPRLPAQARAGTLAHRRPVFPARAQQIGLVNMIVPHDELLPAARELRGASAAFAAPVASIITAVTAD